jgi:hypothetical protein
MKAHGRGCCRIKGSIRVAITRVPRHDLQRIARGTPTLRRLPVVELENRPSRTLSLLPGEIGAEGGAAIRTGRALANHRAPRPR